MLRLRGRGTGTVWAGVFFVALLAIATAFLGIAWPVATAAADTLVFYDNGEHVLQFDVKGNVMTDVTIDGQKAEATSGHIKGMRESKETQLGRKAYIFDGSTCIFVAGHWIGYPPGTKCP